MLYRFEYTNYKDTPTRFFKFDDHSKYGSIYGDFRASNKANVTAQRTGKPYTHNSFEMTPGMPKEAFVTVSDTAIDHAT